MNDTRINRLYDLLPPIYRMQDAEQGKVLEALLQVISEQVNLLEDDIGQLYDNWFIETCQEWVVPYLGALVGYTPVPAAGLLATADTPQARRLDQVLIPRREVANAIHNRRRKGTLALLEELARDVAAWPARAVEAYRLLGFTQALNHQRPHWGRTLDLRRGDWLDLLDTPFDRSAHTVDVRRINSHFTQGRYNILSVGLFVWRLQAYSVTQTPVTPLEQRHCYTFSVLGNDTPLFTKSEPEPEPTQIAGEINLPIPIHRHAFAETVVINGIKKQRAASAYYGKNKSLLIWAPDWPAKNASQPIPRERIVPADLSDWDRYHPVRDTVAVDPVLGRILFPSKQAPKKV